MKCLGMFLQTVNTTALKNLDCELLMTLSVSFGKHFFLRKQDCHVHKHTLLDFQSRVYFWHFHLTVFESLMFDTRAIGSPTLVEKNWFSAETNVRQGCNFFQIMEYVPVKKQQFLMKKIVSTKVELL